MKELTKRLKMVAVKENVIILLRNLQKMYIKDTYNYNLDSDYYKMIINKIDELIEDIKDFKLDYKNHNLFVLKGKFLFVNLIGNIDYMISYQTEEGCDDAYIKVMESYTEELVEEIREYKKLMIEKEWKYL